MEFSNFEDLLPKVQVMDQATSGARPKRKNNRLEQDQVLNLGLSTKSHFFPVIITITIFIITIIIIIITINIRSSYPPWQQASSTTVYQAMLREE